MKNKLSVLLIVFCLFISCKAYSQTFATVDTRILLILHPSMVCFDYNNQAFFRNQDPDKISNEILKKLKEAQAKAEVENKEIDKEIDKLNKECNRISNELIREKESYTSNDLVEFRKQREALKSSLSEQKNKKVDNQSQIKLQQNKIKTIEDKIKELDDVLNNRANKVPNEENIKKYNEMLNNLYGQITDLELKKLDNIDKSMSALYLTKKETEEKLKSITAEIKNIINDIAQKEGCSLVIDNTYAVRDLNRKEKKVLISEEAEPDVTSSTLFHTLSNFKTEDIDISGTFMPREEAIKHLTLGRSVQLENSLKQYLEYKDYLPTRVADLSFGTLFISGGKDITSLCANKLFEKYNVPEYTRQRYTPILTEYMKGNKSTLKGVSGQ